MGKRVQVDIGSLLDITQRISANPLERRIYLTGVIDNENAQNFLQAFQTLDDYKGLITIILNSSGGSEDDGWAIYDAISFASNDVVIVGYGAVQSIAALIMQAGDQRLMMPEARFMIHDGAVQFVAGAIPPSIMHALADENKRMTTRYHTVLSEKSGLSVETVKQMCAQETYLSAAESLQNGFIDAIVQYNGSLVRRKKCGKK